MDNTALVQRFLVAYNRIDQHIRQEASVERRQPFASAVDAFVAKRRWADARRMRAINEVRNFLTHASVHESKYDVVPTPALVDEIEQIAERLEHPRRAIPTFGRRVAVVQAGDSLAGVLRAIAANDFSQFPVYRGDRFAGLLTENGITRWLARHVRDAMSLVDLQDVQVSLLMKQEESTKDVAFMARDVSVPDVVARFAAEPLLEAVLFSHAGRKAEALLGIATRWDILSEVSEAHQ